MSNSSHNFPADLLPDLLSRLPAKALLKFKSVSKLWSSIIEDPKFRFIHTNRLSDSASQSTSSVTQVCLSRYYCNSDERQVPKLCEINWSGGIDGVIEELCPFPLPDIKFWRLIGSSNGVLCIDCLIDKESSLIRWNPLSSKYQIIPHVRPGFDTRGFVAHGFGYDKVNDDYKIVCFDIISYPITCALVYSRKRNTWMTVDCGFAVPKVCSCVLFGGALHWISCDRGWTFAKDALLIVFDLAKEEFNILTAPAKYANTMLSTMRDGRICMIRYRKDFDIRIMLNYDEWIEFRIEPERSVNPLGLIPIAYVESPKPIMMMMEWHGKGFYLVFYDVEDQSLIFNSRVENINGMVNDEFFPYIQTLELFK